VLDVGCGTGEHALMAAALGLDATGIDLASNALRTADEKARDRGLKARFLRYDALKLADLGEVFDTVLECGLFHIFSDGERTIYVDGLRAALKSGGRYFHLGFSDCEPGSWENRRVRKLTQAEIVAAFSDGWHIDSIEPATIEITTDPRGIRAWLVAAVRV
jgi:cyclopropane fatty-acyl-phospholipid synthase-like methyltransferase